MIFIGIFFLLMGVVNLFTGTPLGLWVAMVMIPMGSLILYACLCTKGNSNEGMG